MTPLYALGVHVDQETWNFRVYFILFGMTVDSMDKV